MISTIIDLGITVTFVIYFVKTRKSFVGEKTSLSGKQKLLLSVVFLLALAPIILSLYGYYVAFYRNKTDYYYKKAASIVSYPLYKPKTIPSGFEIATIYRTNTSEKLEGIPNATVVNITTPLFNTKNDKPKMIVIKQTALPANLDLPSFVNGLSQPTNSQQYTTKETPVSIAQNGKGVLRLRDPNTTNLNTLFLFFISPKNTLIELASVNVSQEELLSVANGLTSQ